MTSTISNISDYFIKILLIFSMLLFFNFQLAKAGRLHNFKFRAPANFILDDENVYSSSPYRFVYTGADKVSILVAPMVSTELGVPKTRDGKLDPQFIQGKQNFNSQFGIEDWKMESSHFKTEKKYTLLEISGSYKNFKGIKNNFIERHYFSKNKKIQTVHLIYAEKANKKIVNEALVSLNTFDPNF